MENSEPIHDKKELVIIGGPNGSGKSTFARSYLALHPMDYLNADDIAKELNPEEMDKAKFMAGRVFFRKLNMFLEQEKSVMIESTLSGIYLNKLIPFFHDHGYEVVLVYVFLYSPKVCIERIKERVLKGGHFVPDKDVERRYYRSKENFWNNYKNQADKWFLVYNSENKFLEIALGIKNHFSIKNKEYFYKFVE
ncbi:MAG: AAA family ATPase, partial [Bacteroidales bacterium]